jgi:hypothetical protein
LELKVSVAALQKKAPRTAGPKEVLKAMEAALVTPDAAEILAEA